MGDNEGSSNAAHSAQPTEEIDQIEETTAEERSSGFLGRFLGAWSTGADEGADEAANGSSATATTSHGMMNLRRMRVEDVMIPKAEIVAAANTSTVDELVAAFRDSGYSRIPIYDGTLDTPLGFCHLKDLALRHGFNGKGHDFDISAMLRPLLFVPPSMPIGVLLTKMQAERRHMALVIDEYGGVDGLVTIEDLIEQVVGEIADEHDTEEDQTWLPEKSGVWLAQARTPLDEFEAEIGHSLTEHDSVDEEEIDTLGGLVFMLAGRVPARGEVVAHPDGTEFEVIDADPRRIKRLRVRLPDRA
ncbi:MAG TPA: magnesium/cobalt efflux protein [Rhodobacteraceae bacterium]|nr:magnesium/cobalt efflux protein [Paracoccaceae bacterium]